MSQVTRSPQVDEERTPPINACQSSSGRETIHGDIAYDDIIADVGRQARVAFQVVASEWFQEVLPNIVAEMINALDYTTRPEVDAQVAKEITAWKHRSARPLMKKTLQLSLLTNKTARVVTGQILQEAASLNDLKTFVIKDVKESVANAPPVVRNCNCVNSALSSPPAHPRLFPRRMPRESASPFGRP